MIQIPLKYSKQGFTYEQVYRYEQYAIYEQRDGERFIAYEVFKINQNAEREIFGKVFPESESMPPTNQWGKNSFTVRTIEEAMNKIKEMKQVNNKSIITL